MTDEAGSGTEDVVVRVRGLRKTYRDFWGRRAYPALRGVDLDVRRGESHALLGPNGSGKTTTLRILLGLLKPSAGSVELLGGDPRHAATRRRVGFLPESSTLHGFLRCTETLSLYGRLYGLDRSTCRTRAAQLLERVQLTAAAKKRVHELSHGMRRRLAFAVALMGEPEVLVLDEPTAGMDPLVRESVLELIQEHVARGGSLLVTSHLLGDIEGVAGRATLLAQGEVVRTGPLDVLLTREGLREYLVRAGPDADAGVRAAVEAAGGEIVGAGPARSRIEDLFLDTYRGRSGREAEDDRDAGDPGSR